jgi:arylsulfatase A-like enzyme
MPKPAWRTLLVAAALAGGCQREPSSHPSSIAAATTGAQRVAPAAPIVLVSIDTLRPDHLPPYGYAGVETPAIDALRRDSVLFARAYSQVPLTLPSHVSILTGLLPPAHGVRDNGGFHLDASAHPTLPVLLHDAGYATGGFVSSFVLHPTTGIDAGFDVYDAGHPGEPLRAAILERRGADTVDAALRWLEGIPRERPFFLFVHLYEPHAAYRPPEPFATRYRARPYDGEIASADAALGALLAGLRRTGLYERAAIVLLSDHGEGLGDHGERGHGILLYREELQVPLLVKLPGEVRAGSTVERPAALVDVAPTVLRLVGRPVPAAMQGQDLLAYATTRAAPRQIYAETLYPRLHLGWSELVSLVDGRWHYVHGPTPELFDLAADPRETHNAIGAERRTYSQLRAAAVAATRLPETTGSVDAESARRLASLGYAGTPRLARGALADPRARRAAIGDLEAAGAATWEGRWRDCASILDRTLAAEPALLDGWFSLGACRERLGEPEAALVAYRRALALAPDAPEALFFVARTLYGLGRLDEAKRHAEAMVATELEGRDGHQMLAAIALRQGDLDAAFAHAEEAGTMSAAFRHDLARALADRGEAALREGMESEGRVDLAKAQRLLQPGETPGE